MPKSDVSESESEEKVSSEEETENETADEKGGPKKPEKLSDYERLRLKRIEENKIRMEALGLRQMASSLMGSVQKSKTKENDKKGKRKMVHEDEEYNPAQEDDETSSSGEEDEHDEDFSSQKKKGNISTSKKRGPIKNPVTNSDFVEDDDALMQAIALSLQDSAGFLDVKSSSQSPSAHLRDIATSKTPATQITASDKRKENIYIQDDSGKRKRKKQVTSRVQMSEDEVLVHYFQFDETEKGGFTLRDLQRLAIAHDFTWSEKEMADMISCFDSDGDGKINFDDFHKIVCRCNMLKSCDDVGAGKLGLRN